MKIDSLQPILESHPFLRGASAEMLELMTGCARNERFAQGDYLIKEGHSAERFLLIRDGVVAISASLGGEEETVLESLSDGDALGWSWLMPPYVWTFDAKAVSPVSALSFDAACLRAKMADAPDLGYEILSRYLPIMADRLKAARLEMLAPR